MFTIGRWIRYVRRRAILLSSWRREETGALNRWIRLQMLKSLIPVLLLTVPDRMGWYDTPLFIGLSAIFGLVLYNGLIIWHALTASARLDKRQIAKLETLGCSMPNFSTAMSSKALWKGSLSGKTARQLIKDKSLMAEYYKQIGHKGP